MKIIFLLTVLLSFEFALANKIDGVPMNCSEKAGKVVAKYDKLSLVAACRDRADNNKEHYTYCDGSGCSGFTTTFANNKCTVSDMWDGQDDQDPIDPVEWKQNCLVEEDFNEWVSAPKTSLNSLKIGDSAGIKDSSVYQLLGNAKKATAVEKAEAVGKKLRHAYYEKNYQVDGYRYRVISLDTALALLKKSEGEFKAISRKDEAAILSWYEDKKVEYVVQMHLQTNYMSGTGLEDNLIFISSEDSEPVLVVNRFYYSE